MRPRAWIGLAALALAAAGCGLKGPLYLPEKSEVTIRPGPAPAEAEPAPQPTTTETPPAAATPPPPPPSPPQEPPRTGPDRG